MGVAILMGLRMRMPSITSEMHISMLNLPRASVSVRRVCRKCNILVSRPDRYF